MSNGCSHDGNNIKTSPERDKPRGERKSIEDTVISLRKELQVLYESLRDKNELLMLLEQDVRDRDKSLNYLRAEYKKIDDTLSNAFCTKCMKKIECVVDSSNGRTENASSADELGKLQIELTERDELVCELNKKVIRLSDNLIFVQKESLAKDDRIDELHREIDKFRQVVRPFTMAVVERKGDEDFVEHPGIENTRVILANEPPRLKRTAISAEPLSQMAGGGHNELIKIPKTSV